MINEVKKESPAFVAGLKKNDIIYSIDGKKVNSILDVSKYIITSTAEYIDFTVLRFDQKINLKVRPNLVPSEDNLGNKINKRRRKK